jgi:hypothetical protein
LFARDAVLRLTYEAHLKDLTHEAHLRDLIHPLMLGQIAPYHDLGLRRQVLSVPVRVRAPALPALG